MVEIFMGEGPHPGDAAARAGVVVVPLNAADELRAADTLLRAVWRTGDGAPPFPPDLMTVLAYTGGYVAGAYAGETLVGASAGFVTAGGHLHSHVVGVAPDRQGKGVGLSLKLHQRAWASEHGLDAVTWTFDPLVRRNAYFNLNLLGAEAKAYLPDFYGPLIDGINDGDASDRLWVRWPVSPELRPDPPDVVDRVPVLESGGDGEPLSREPTGRPARCATPPDVEELRGKRPDQARRWRARMRAALGSALEEGYWISGFTRSGWYLLDGPNPEKTDKEAQA